MVQATILSTTTTEQQQQQQGDQIDMEQDTNKTIGGKVKPSYKHIPHSQKPPHLVAKRNARERRRVQAVNQAFYKLRKSVPIENRNKRVSKVKTLQRAIDYIRRLERILAEDDEPQTSAVASTNGNQANRNQQLTASQVSRLHHETQPLQQTNCNQLNSSSSTRDEDEKTMDKPSNDDSDLLKSSLVRKRPQNLAGKRVQKANNITTELEATNQRGQTRGRKQLQSASKSKQLTDELHGANQVTRAQQRHAQGVAGPQEQEDNNYAVTRLKSTNISGNGSDSATEFMTPGQCCATTSAVSYGKPHHNITTTAIAANRLAGVPPQPTLPLTNHHYPNHHYQYYIDSPTSSSMMASSGPEHSDQFAYNHQHHHLQLPSDQIQNVGHQQRACLSGEISSSSMMTNGPSLCGNYLPVSYQYAASPMDQTSHRQLDTNSHQNYQRLVNHNDSYLKPVDSPTTTTTATDHQQRYFPPPLARHYQTVVQNTWSQHQESVRETTETPDDCNKKASAKMVPSLGILQQQADKEQVGELTSSESLRRKQAEYERSNGLIGVTAAQSMPADSTSCSLSAQKDSTNRPSALNGIRSPPVSICSSSSLSPSTTTLKSQDLSCNSSGGSSTVGIMFLSSNTTRNDKSPPTSASVVCRQQNKSSLENGAHTTTSRDYMQQQQQQQQQQRGPGESTNRQQQVNNYGGQLPAYAAHLSCEAHSSNSAAVDYLRSGGRQLQRPPTDEQREIQTKLTGTAQRNGSRSSSAISPDPTTTTTQQQLTLVGENYLANNNLHGTDQQQHSGQLFQYQPTAYYNQQHLHQHHEHHQRQSHYQQGQHFLSNHHGHQQHNSNHLSDHHHHHHHHLQSDSAEPTSELRQQNANTTELVTTTNINSHHQQLGRLIPSNSTTTITTASAQFTALPL